MPTLSLIPHAHQRQALALFAQDYSVPDVARTLGQPYHRVQYLYNRWRIHGTLALMTKPTKTFYSFTTKKEIVDRFLAGQTQRSLVIEYGLSSEKLIQSWGRAWRVYGDAGLEPKPKGRPQGSAGSTPVASEEAKLRRRIEQLEAQNAYLKALRDLNR